MKLMLNRSIGLRPASSSTEVAAWSSGTAVLKGRLRRDTAETPQMIYRARSTLRAANNTVRPGLAPALWAVVAPAASTWELTGAVVSEFPAWATGGSIDAGEVFYDPFDRSDYEAVVAIGTNSIRPSEAVESITPSTARLWARRGIANAFRAFDGETLTRTVGNASADVVAQFDTAAACRTVMLFGLRGAASVTVKGLNASTGAVLETETKAMAYTGDSGTQSTATLVFDADYSRFEVTLTRDSAAARVECAMIAAGAFVDIGATQQPVTVTAENFSRTESNQWGSIRFMQGGYLTESKQTVMVDQARMDFVVQTLNRMQGQPMAIDLNSADTDYEHLRIWGFYRDVAARYVGHGGAAIDLTIRALVEVA